MFLGTLCCLAASSLDELWVASVFDDEDRDDGGPLGPPGVSESDEEDENKGVSLESVSVGPDSTGS